MTKDRSIHLGDQPPLAACWAIFVGCFLAACSADFRSGETRCSPAGECPSGFSCSDGLCVSGVAVDRRGGASGTAGNSGKGGSTMTGTGGAGEGGAPGSGGSPGTGGTTPPATGGMTGAGGTSATGGSTGTGGTKADAGMTSDAGMTPVTSTCSKPEFPQPCPAKNGVAGVCATAEADCSTLVKCGADSVVCRKGQVVNCMYPNRCSPAANTCPIPASPTETQFCPAAGGAGPICTAPTKDCTTLVACAKGVVTCEKGYKADCNYPANPCGPVGKVCPKADFPQFCPALGAAGPTCTAMGSDCSTVTVCPDNGLAVCPSGQRVDCTKPKTMRCVAKATADGGS